MTAVEIRRFRVAVVFADGTLVERRAYSHVAIRSAVEAALLDRYAGRPVDDETAGTDSTDGGARLPGAAVDVPEAMRIVGEELARFTGEETLLLHPQQTPLQVAVAAWQVRG